MFLFPAPPVPMPDPVIAENTVYYDVKGSTAKELVASLNENGNRATDGRYWGETRFSYSWGYDTRQVDGRCELVKPTMSATITRIYPRWVMASPPPAALEAKWTAMIAALEHHEDLHVDLIRKAVLHVGKLMQANSMALRCTELSDDLYNAGVRTFRIAAEQGADLDERSRHGSLEGVRLRW